MYVGQSVNARNIEKIVVLFKSKGGRSTMNLKSKGEKNTLKSLEWFRGVVFAGSLCAASRN